MIAGPSQCGKTTFTKQLLEQADSLFERPIRKIVYCYEQWQECFRNMTAQVTFVGVFPKIFLVYFQQTADLEYSYWMT